MDIELKEFGTCPDRSWEGPWVSEPSTRPTNRSPVGRVRPGEPLHVLGTRPDRLAGDSLALPAGPWEGTRAFTLLEVLLAVAIAAGMLAVVLFFYTQAANLRVQLFYETSKISAVRLLLDRLTADLSNAQRCESMQVGLTGTSETLEFVRLELPNFAGWTNAPEVAPAAGPPFRLIRYAALRAPGETNVSGLTRSEEPLLHRPVELVEETDLSSTNAAAARRAPMTIDQFRYLRFRYWNGAAWLDSWSAPELPAGVEVSLGAEPLPEEPTPDQPDPYPPEVFRRVIYLPGHSSSALSNQPDALFEEELP
ncbi:MAG: type II secretion system protein [Verrucomicrobia bacterium]|nr:type II secretion system protein [Verrucomicrobiota bacterium]